MPALDEASLDLIFRQARSHNRWADVPVTDDDIRAIYDLCKWGPTAVNSQPARIVWVRSPEAKARLEPLLDEGNRIKSATAPVVAIVGYDLDFPDTLHKIFHVKGAHAWFPHMDKREWIAFRNSTLQGAYLMVAARALGFDCGPMSGFDNAAVDAAFFAGTNVRSNFICSIGHGDPAKLAPRSPRLSFEEAGRVA